MPAIIVFIEIEIQMVLSCYVYFSYTLFSEKLEFQFLLRAANLFIVGNTVYHVPNIIY